MEGHHPSTPSHNLLPKSYPTSTPLLPSVKALAFDVFGTCVDWRTTITSTLHASFQAKSTSSSIPGPLRAHLAAQTREHCGRLAQAWRDEYTAFCRGFVPGTTPWRDIDTVHRESLAALLEARGLSGAYSEADVGELAVAWHHLRPWDDAVEGLGRLGGGGEGGRGFITAALSNGNVEILKDLDGHLGGAFRVLISAAAVGTYKPHPSVYREAVEKLAEGRAGEVALVAAHLGDLEGARRCGLRTVYVEREEEEDWDKEKREEARGWVDVWISVDEGGFVELARKLGC